MPIPKASRFWKRWPTGFPVVQPNHGAFPEIVGKTRGGVLYDPNEPKFLAAALDDLARDRDRFKELSLRAAHGVRERYSIATMAKRTQEVYQSVTQGAPVAQG